MTPIQCVHFLQTNLIRRYLRRYFAMTDQCPHDYGDGYKRCCDAQIHLDDIEPVRTEDGYIPAYSWDRGDDRWPKACAGCGREFPQDKLDDHTAPWQVHVDYLFMQQGGVTLIPLRDLPVGAIWSQDFGHGPTSIHCRRRTAARQGLPIDAAPDENVPHLFCRTPGGIWDMDTTATNGDGWELTGEPPLITARPSILHSRGNQWHGWLTNGVLTQC